MKIPTALAAILLLSSPALAQQSVTSAFEGFSGRGDQPVNIEADNLEVKETEQTAIFSGHAIEFRLPYSRQCEITVTAVSV